MCVCVGAMLATGVPVVVGVRKRLLFSPAVSNVTGSGGTLTPLQKTKRSLHNRFAKAFSCVKICCVSSGVSSVQLALHCDTVAVCALIFTNLTYVRHNNDTISMKYDSSVNASSLWPYPRTSFP